MLLVCAAAIIKTRVEAAALALVTGTVVTNIAALKGRHYFVSENKKFKSKKKKKSVIEASI